MVSRFRAYKSELPLHRNDDVRRNLWCRQIFFTCRAGANYHGKALISCRAELVVSSSPSRFQLRGGRPPKISFVPRAASIGSHHTTTELVQYSLINCWSHVQNATRGPWPSMQGRGDGRRKRPWSGLPAPNVVIRKKSVLAVLTPKERTRSSTKLQVAVFKSSLFARLRVRVRLPCLHALAMRRVNFPG
jgi:hypothetical protein